jgi:hypothetical protein
MAIKTMFLVSDKIKPIIVKRMRQIASPKESLTGIQAAPSVMEYDKTQKSAVQITQEPSDELAA